MSKKTKKQVVLTQCFEPYLISLEICIPKSLVASYVHISMRIALDIELFDYVQNMRNSNKHLLNLYMMLNACGILS